MCSGRTRGRRHGDHCGLSQRKHRKTGLKGQKGVSKRQPVCSWGYAQHQSYVIQPYLISDLHSISWARNSVSCGCGRGLWVGVHVSMVAALESSQLYVPGCDHQKICSLTGQEESKYPRIGLWISSSMRHQRAWLLKAVVFQA